METLAWGRQARVSAVTSTVTNAPRFGGGTVDVGGCAWAGARGIWECSSLPLDFALNLKVL